MSEVAAKNRYKIDNGRSHCGFRPLSTNEALIAGARVRFAGHKMSGRFPQQPWPLKWANNTLISNHISINEYDHNTH